MFGELVFTYNQDTMDTRSEAERLLAQRAAAIALYQRTTAFQVALQISELEAKLRSLGVNIC